MLDVISYISVCFHCLLSCQWALLRRDRVCLLYSPINLHTSIRSLLRLLQAEQPVLSQPFLICQQAPATNLVSFHWVHSYLSMSLVCQGAQNLSLHVRYDLPFAEKRGIITFIDHPVTLLWYVMSII